MPQRIAAFFDVDHTLIAVNSARSWLAHLRKTGQISTLGVLRCLWWLSQYRMGRLDYDTATKMLMRDYQGRRVDELTAEVERWFDLAIAPTVSVQAKQAVERHRKQGHALVMLTSGTVFSVRPLQRMLGFEALLCTEIVEADGCLTGEILLPACYGAGKVVHAERWAANTDVDLSRSFFYSDSISDLPMLERVGFPRVINPDPKLGKVARARGWPVERWRDVA